MIQPNRSVRRRTLTAGALLTLAGVLTPMALSSPASAAVTGCGQTVTSDPSVHYYACLTSSLAGKVTVTDNFRNTGATVTRSYRTGKATNGGLVAWGPIHALHLSAGNSTLVTTAACTPGSRIQATLRVTKSDGSWGPIAYSTVVVCK